MPLLVPAGTFAIRTGEAMVPWLNPLTLRPAVRWLALRIQAKKEKENAVI